MSCSVFEWRPLECERPCSCSGDSGWCFGLFESSRNFPSQSSNIWQECKSSARVDDNCLGRLVWQSPLPHSQHASVHHLWYGTRPNTQNCWQKRCSAFSMWEMWESLGVIAGWAQDVMMSWCEGWGRWDRRFWSQFLLRHLILIILQMVENTVICYCPSFLRTPQQTKPKINIALCIYCHSFKQLVDTCPGLPTSSTDVWIQVVCGSICHYLANMINCITILYIYIIEGSLEVKLPTIWTVEKQKWKESEEKRSEERRCRCAKR